MGDFQVIHAFLYYFINRDEKEITVYHSYSVSSVLVNFSGVLCPSSRAFSFLFGGRRLFTQELLRYTFGKPTWREEVAIWKPKPN
jgi:hypothetical protein